MSVSVTVLQQTGEHQGWIGGWTRLEIVEENQRSEFLAQTLAGFLPR